MANCTPGECENDPKYTTPVKLQPYPGGSEGGHEFVTELPETGATGVEYLVLTDISDCETFEGSFAWNAEAECWVQTSGSGGGGGGATYSFAETDDGWQAKRNGTVIFTYVDKDTVDTYRETAKGFEILRNGSVIFSHDEKGSEYEIKDFVDDETGKKGWQLYKDGTAIYTHYETDPKEYVFENTADGWQVKEGGVVKFTYTDLDTKYSCEKTDTGWVFKENGTTKFTYDDVDTDTKYSIEKTDTGWVFKEDGTVKFSYVDPAMTESDGTYYTAGTLTETIKGSTTMSASAVTGLNLSDAVIGETLVFDASGTVGRLTAVDDANGRITLETITTSPGERRGTRLGAVDDSTDLPATTAAALALGWQTPLAGDFAYVREDSAYGDHLTEYVVQSIDASGNIVWGYSHTLNAGNYLTGVNYSDGSPIPVNADGTVTLPADQDTKYDFSNVEDASGNIIGWVVKDHETGNVLYTYNDTSSDTTYTFEDVKDTDGTILGWRVKNDITGAIVYTHTDSDENTKYTFANTADGFRVTDSDGNGWIHVEKTVANAADVRPNTAVNFYVDADNGDDINNDGKTVATPFKTIQKAINSAPVLATRLAEYDSYYLGCIIYVNTSATAHYRPCFFESTCPIELRGYDPAQSSYDSDTGINSVFDTSYDTSKTFTIDANAYDHPTVADYKIKTNCLYVRDSRVYLRFMNIVLNQKCIATAAWIGHGSFVEFGDNYAANTLHLKHTLTINANTIAANNQGRAINPATGKYETYVVSGNSGCEGLGVHYQSCVYVYGRAVDGSVSTITASNWGVASNRDSDVRFEGRVVINGGYNTNGTYGGVYADSNSRLSVEDNGWTAASGTAGRDQIFSRGRGAAISCGTGSWVGLTNSWVQKEFGRPVNPGANYSAVITASNNGMISFNAQNSAFLSITMHNSDTYSRLISANWGGKICIDCPTSGTCNFTQSTSSTQQVICASEMGEITLWGGSGTTLPKLTGKTGYAAYNGGKLTYSTIGAFSGTTQRATSSGGRIYTGNQNTIGSY